MRNIIAALIIGLSLICVAASATAATVSGLYEARVPVAGEDTASRNQAIAEALQQVLIKITGRDPAPGSAELTVQAARYVQQYRYHREPSPEGELQTRLWVRFDKTGLDRVLHDRGLPVWGSNRPGVLVWLGAETAGRREMVGVENVLATALHDAAAARGLPLQLPLLDLEDQARLTSADLWSDYAPAVQQASERYSQPLVLTGRLRRVASDHWSGRWTLYQGADAEGIEANAADAATAISEAIGQVTELLAGRYAPAGGLDGPELLRVKIIGVAGLRDYARAMQLVGDRQVVERVAVRSAEGDALVLEVLARGGRDALAQALDLVRDLNREPDPVPAYEPLPAFDGRPQPAAAAPVAAPVVEGQPTAAAPGEAAPVVSPLPQAAGPAAAELPPAEPPVSLVYSLNP